MNSLINSSHELIRLLLKLTNGNTAIQTCHCSDFFICADTSNWFYPRKLALRSLSFFGSTLRHLCIYQPMMEFLLKFHSSFAKTDSRLTQVLTGCTRLRYFTKGIVAKSIALCNCTRDSHASYKLTASLTYFKITRLHY